MLGFSRSHVRGRSLLRVCERGARGRDAEATFAAQTKVQAKTVADLDLI
jgi:hypothetical protein